MVIFIILLCLLGIGWYCSTTGKFETIGVFLFTGSLIALIISLISIPVSHFEIIAEIKQFEITKQTYEFSRKNSEYIENAAIQIDIAKLNRWLAKRQYFDAVLFDLWIPDEIKKLEPIK